MTTTGSPTGESATGANIKNITTHVNAADLSISALAALACMPQNSLSKLLSDDGMDQHIVKDFGGDQLTNRDKPCITKAPPSICINYTRKEPARVL